MKDLHEISLRSRQAYYDLSVASAELRNQAILTLADVLNARFGEIWEANQKDYAAAEKDQLPPPLLHRLIFDEKKLAQTVAGLKSLSALPDPLGKTTYSKEKIARDGS